MAVRSKNSKAPAPKRPAKAAPQKAPAKASTKEVRKAAPKAAASKSILGKALKGAVKAVKGVVATKAAPIKVAPPVKASAKVGAPIKGAKAGKGGKGGVLGNPNAAAVERVTERLMGRASAEPTSDTVCREVACEGLGTSAGYCRLHYIKNWKKIKRKEVILKEGKLNQYIEELVSKYPEKYIEAIRLDLANDKEFAKVIVDLDLDENDEDFDAEGSGDADVSIDTLKREFEEDADAF